MEGLSSEDYVLHGTSEILTLSASLGQKVRLARGKVADRKLVLGSRCALIKHRVLGCLTVLVGLKSSALVIMGLFRHQ